MLFPVDVLLSVASLFLVGGAVPAALSELVPVAGGGVLMSDGTVVEVRQGAYVPGPSEFLVGVFDCRSHDEGILFVQ